MQISLYTARVLYETTFGKKLEDNKPYAQAAQEVFDFCKRDVKMFKALVDSITPEKD
jgi:hypothetical protein